MFEGIFKSTRYAKVDEDSKVEENISESVEVEEEWVWVEGYKGTDADMRCQNDFQYELGKQFDMPEDAEIKECASGFHLCLTLKDVFKFYDIGCGGNRFFKVRALVRAKDRDEYYHPNYEDIKNPYARCVALSSRALSGKKLVAKSIELLEELTADEILKDTVAKNWSPENKQLALKCGIVEARHHIQATELTELGYSLPFATYLIKAGKYDAAKAVGSQEGLSMDMKCLIIFTK